jgi:aryl-alcohol dehydrogenase-like predicted oxidoreductase
MSLTLCLSVSLATDYSLRSLFVDRNKTGSDINLEVFRMKYRLLGNSGLRVSEVALGAMTFGEDWGWGSSRDEARKIYDAYRAAGGNFIDTANVYTNGTSESFVGDFIRDDRQSIVLATKYTCVVTTGDVNAGGNHRKSMMQAVENSLRKLKTDYIDLYWLHVWDQMTPVDEVMRAFDDLVHQGKVLYTGISDTPAWWIAQANTLAELRGWTRFAGLQIEYSLSQRTVERDLIPMAKAFNLGLVAWSPLAGGVLSGKYHSGKASDGRYQDKTTEASGRGRTGERIDRIISALEKLSVETDRSLAQVALAWLRYRDIPVIPIIGARHLQQLEDNLVSLGQELTREQIATLDEASAIEMGFPHDTLNRERIKGFVYGGMREQILTA